jgi:hypothetical protein
MRVNSAEAKGTRTHGVMGSNLGGHVILHYAKNYCTTLPYFLKICYRTSLYCRIPNGASVDPTSKVRSYAMLNLPIV